MIFIYKGLPKVYTNFAATIEFNGFNRIQLNCDRPNQNLVILYLFSLVVLKFLMLNFLKLDKCEPGLTDVRFYMPLIEVRKHPKSTQ